MLHSSPIDRRQIGVDQIIGSNFNVELPVVEVDTGEVGCRAGVFDDVTGNRFVGVKIVTRGSEIEADSIQRVSNGEVGDSSGGEIVDAEINLVGYLECSASSLPEKEASFPGVLNFGQPRKVSSWRLLRPRRHCVTATAKRRVGVGNLWENLRSDETTVHPGVLVPSHLALHAVTSLARVLGEIPGNRF